MAKRRLRVDFDDSIIELEEYNFTFTVPTIPNFPEKQPSRYVVYLPEAPLLSDPDKLPTIAGLNRITGRLPFSGEFRTADTIDRLIPQRLEFHEDQAGDLLTCHFYGIGGPIDDEDFLTELEMQNKVGFCNSKNNVEIRQYVFNQEEHFNLLAAVQSLDDLPKTIFLKNGDYSIPNGLLLFASKNIIELKGETKNGVRIFIAGSGGIEGNSQLLSSFTILFASDITVNQRIVDNCLECSDINIFPDDHTTKTGIGFYNCKQIRYCKGKTLNIGYSNSNKMHYNDAENCTTPYNQCYADNGIAYPVSNTPSGGFNTITT